MRSPLRKRFYTAATTGPAQNGGYAVLLDGKPVRTPSRNLLAAPAQALSAEVENAIFDPWQALAAHRPLGDVMRARKVVYFASQQGRGAA